MLDSGSVLGIWGHGQWVCGRKGFGTKAPARSWCGNVCGSSICTRAEL